MLRIFKLGNIKILKGLNEPISLYSKNKAYKFGAFNLASPSKPYIEHYIIKIVFNCKKIIFFII